MQERFQFDREKFKDLVHFVHYAASEFGPERIPYYAAYAMLPPEITDEDLADATEEAARLAPAIEAERRDGPIF